MQNNNNGAAHGDALATQQLQNASLLEAGTVLSDRFRIISHLGQGAQASVYFACDMLLDTRIALKYIPGANRHPEKMEVLRNEVLTGRKLQHPNIIRIHDIYTHHADAFFTMAYVAGEPLYVRLNQPVTARQFEQWKVSLLQAVAACHHSGIRHGDLKPDNILIDEEDNLVLIDFGIGQSVNSAEQTSGHESFTAPEILQTGIPAATSDVYSAGKVLALALDAVIFSAKSIQDRRWERRQRNMLKAMTAVPPLKRPDIDTLLTQTEEKKRGRAGRTLLVASAVLLVALTGLYLGTRSAAPVLTGTQRVVIVSAPDVPVLSVISAMTALPFSTSPQFDVLDPGETAEISRNLSLKPLQNRDDRTDLAITLDAGVVIALDASEASSSTWLIRATGYAGISDDVLFDLATPFSADTLTGDAARFAGELSEALAGVTDTPSDVPDMAFISDVVATMSPSSPGTAAEALASLRQSAPDYPAGWVLSAEEALNNNDLASARIYLDRLSELSNSEPYWQLKGQYIRALLNYDASLALEAITLLTDRFPGRAELLAEKGMVLEWNGDAAGAMQAWLQATEKAPGNGQYWFELARLKIINGNINEAINNELTKALVAFRIRGDKEGEGLVLNAFGVAHLRLAEYEAASRYFTDALMLRTADTFPAQRATTLANLANASAVLGNYDTAEEALNEASDILADLGDDEELAHVLDTLGFLFEEQGQYARALINYKRGLDIRASGNNQSEKAASMSNVAYMHFLTGDFSLADIYWQQALNQFMEAKDKAHTIRTQQNMAQLSLVKGDWIAAGRLLTRTDGALTEAMHHEQMINHLLYSYLNFVKGDLEQSFTRLAEAEALAVDTTDARSLAEITLWHGEVCLLIADFTCLTRQINKATGSVTPEMTEQMAVLNWLKLASSSQQAGNTVTLTGDQLTTLFPGNIPVLTEIKIALDLQQRLNLDKDSPLMQRAEALVKPVYYQYYLQLLYLQAEAGEDVAGKLEQALAAHPDYWRSHLYYRVLKGERNTQLASESLEIWLSRLTEDQARQYRVTYLEQ